MDETVRHHNPNPTLTANLLSRMCYWWLNPLFRKGYKGRLEESDMFNVCPDDSSHTAGEKVQSSWEKELTRLDRGKDVSLLRAVLRAYGVRFMLLGLIALLEALVKVGQPLFLAEFLDYFARESTTTTEQAWLYASGVVFCSVVLTITHHPYFFGTSLIGMRIRVGLCSLVYRKCLRLSNKSLNESSIGQIVNLMSNDVARFDQGIVYHHFLWVGPIQCVVAVIYFWYRLGPAVMAALAVMILLMPIQFLFGKMFTKFRRKTAVNTDKRVKVMNEIISGIRIIKLYCWEKPFGRLVENLRRQEVRQLRRTRRAQACVMGPYIAGAQFALFLFALVLVLVDREEDIRPGMIFMVMGVVQSLRLTCGMFVPLASQHLAETLVVLKRIQKFMMLEELQETADQKSANVPLKNGIPHGDIDMKMTTGVEAEHLTAKWEGSGAMSNTLEDITISVKPGHLVAVIGPVGSGKTSLLMSILGELSVLSGSVKTRGKIAYVSQHPWIFSGSLRQNILFGKDFDKARYDKIIRISALSRDLSILPNGDATLIGDRGVTLSGGQRARVSLARALYMDGDVYLLDDPLSAVDTKVGRHIFDKCVMRLLKDKPRILVTHQVQLLPVADNIVILTDGRVVTQGTYNELSKSGVNFAELLKIPKEETSDLERSESGTDHVTRTDSMTSKHSLGEDYVPDMVQLPEEEERETGNIDLQVFISYFKAGGGIFLFVLLVLLLLLAQVFIVGSDWWLARWTNKNEDRHRAIDARDKFLNEHNLVMNTAGSSSLLNSTQHDIPDVDTYFILYVYAGIIVVMFACCFVRALMFFKMAVMAGENLHNMMFARILRATMAFFDTNPVGRVLNRFSKDTGQTDDHLPWVMFDFLQMALQAVGAIIVSVVFNLWMCIAAVPLVVIFFMLRRYYVQTSRSVKRLEGTTRSPVFSHLSASLQGLHTIRAMHMEERLTAQFDSHQDLHSEAWYLFLITSRWLGIRLDCLASLFTACVVYSSMLASDNVDGGFVGLTVVYTMNLMGMFQWGVRQSIEMENQMVSVERILQYTRLPTEADLESKPGQKPADTWPTAGSILAKGVSLQYSSSAPFVLRGLNFHIHGGEKIGIVGRTGAGKSSLITALFRMAEPEGDLTIDGVSIHSLGLHDLRRVISIIPQDPVLFTGPVRRNLDPFNEYSDSQLWRALEEVQLKEAILANPDNLHMEVNEGGSNFSAGQRQLMCLARAVLGNTRILVIDEATANVDPITDELIQQTIRDKFKACTVLTIAHRLHTIIDSDRIMVLDAGEIVEMDTPANLLAAGNSGVFYSMVEQLGKTELENLTQLVTSSTLSDSSKMPPPLTNGINHTKPASPPKESETSVPEVISMNGGENVRPHEAGEGMGVENEAFTAEDTRL